MKKFRNPESGRFVTEDDYYEILDKIEYDNMIDNCDETICQNCGKTTSLAFSNCQHCREWHGEQLSIA